MKLVINEEQTKRIRVLTRTVPHTEWFGVIVYKYEKDTLELVDWFPIALGEPAGVVQHTNNVPTILEQRGLLDDFLHQKVFIGIIHSHHSMASFFSNVDRQELMTNTSDMGGFYLSLIVNNAGNFCAAFGIESETVSTYDHFITGARKFKSVEIIPIDVVYDKAIFRERNEFTEWLEAEEKRKLEERRKTPVKFNNAQNKFNFD